jgi:hypothetical protein
MWARAAGSGAQTANRDLVKLFQASQNDETNSRTNEAIFLKQETTRKQTLDTIPLGQTRRGSNEKASND